MIHRTRHDIAPYLRYSVMVLRRATLYRVISREGRVRIAPISSDRPGPNARRDAASEIEMQREPGSRVAVDELTAVTLPPALPVRVRSLVVTEAGSTAWLKFTSY